MPIVPISSTDDPRIADYLGVRDAELRRDRFDAPGGLFVAEGELVFRRLVASSYATRSVLLTPTRLQTVQDAVDALADDIPVYLVDQSLMNSIVGFNIHRGVLALGVRGPEPDLDQLLRQASCVVVLEDLVNHDNIGAVFRNVAALAGVGPGGGAVLLSPRCADPLYRKAIRVSIGWSLGVPFGRLEAWPGDLSRLRAAGYAVLALHPGPASRPIADVVRELSGVSRKVALVAGTEGEGLSRPARESIDYHVQIPMRGRVRADAGATVDSLNVGVAVAIALDRVAEALPSR
jgi:tRNA G18 (ribose-2'-O)-methylase SpoU